MTHGPVSIWDYYLTNYADDGSVRYSPSKTTFALGEKPVPHPAYSPDAELGEDGKATVTIMFNSTVSVGPSRTTRLIGVSIPYTMFST